MMDSAIPVNLFLMQYYRMLLADIPDERMAEQPVAGVNHPAWILGHLAVTADGSLEKLGGQKMLPPAWSTLFGLGSKPTPSRGDYPSKDELVRAVEQTYQDLRQKPATANPEQLSRPTTNPRAKQALPTLKELVVFVLSGHLGVHLAGVYKLFWTVGASTVIPISYCVILYDLPLEPKTAKPLRNTGFLPFCTPQLVNWR